MSLTSTDPSYSYSVHLEVILKILQGGARFRVGGKAAWAVVTVRFMVVVKVRVGLRIVLPNAKVVRQEKSRA